MSTHALSKNENKNTEIDDYDVIEIIFTTYDMKMAYPDVINSYYLISIQKIHYKSIS